MKTTEEEKQKKSEDSITEKMYKYDGVVIQWKSARFSVLCCGLIRQPVKTISNSLPTVAISI